MIRAFASVAMLALVSCGESQTQTPPPPQALTAEAIGRYCGMNVLEHPGPKGQIILASRIDPVWFSSARDAIAFTIMPEEPKDIRAIYVSDMAKAADWNTPGADNWVEARQAVFVIASSRRGGMGAPETVPFSNRAAAEAFMSTNGGRIVDFAGVPKSYVLGTDGEGAEVDAAPSPHAH